MWSLLQTWWGEGEKKGNLPFLKKKEGGKGGVLTARPWKKKKGICVELGKKGRGGGLIATAKGGERES